MKWMFKSVQRLQKSWEDQVQCLNFDNFRYTIYLFFFAGAIIEQFVPPEGDGKKSLITPQVINSSTRKLGIINKINKSSSIGNLMQNHV